MTDDIAYLLSGDPGEVITWRGHSTYYGGTVRGSRRTIAHLEAADRAAREKFGAGVIVLQSAYNSTVPASAGTHDYDACLDVYVSGVDWWDQQRFFREQGWAAWYRYPPAFGRHIHMISLGFTTTVGKYVDGGKSLYGRIVTSSQVADYYAHRTGLSGHATDATWHPADISKTVFDYATWRAELGDDMPYTEDQLTKIVRTAVRAELEPVKEQAKRIRQAIMGQVRALRAETKDKKILARLDAIEAAIGDES